MTVEPEDLRVGTRVRVDGRVATVRFLGYASFGSVKDEYVGLELDAREGDNDGQVNGVFYFATKAGHGLFVRRYGPHVFERARAAPLASSRARTAPKLDSSIFRTNYATPAGDAVRRVEIAELGAARAASTRAPASGEPGTPAACGVGASSRTPGTGPRACEPSSASRRNEYAAQIARPVVVGERTSALTPRQRVIGATQAILASSYVETAGQPSKSTLKRASKSRGAGAAGASPAQQGDACRAAPVLSPQTPSAVGNASAASVAAAGFTSATPVAAATSGAGAPPGTAAMTPASGTAATGAKSATGAAPATGATPTTAAAAAAAATPTTSGSPSTGRRAVSETKRRKWVPPDLWTVPKEAMTTEQRKRYHEAKKAYKAQSAAAATSTGAPVSVSREPAPTAAA